ncbi:MAG: SxtJ family membrane protein [Parvibaculaceae bacterium]
MSENFHERIREEEEVKLPSERSLGITFAAVFALIGFIPLVHGGHVRWWAVAIAAVFLAAALIYPIILRPLNKVWMKFGLLLHKIVNPIMLGLMFGLIVVPIALLVRLIKGRLLTPKPEPEATSYWIIRDPPGPEPDTMRHQF